MSLKYLDVQRLAGRLLDQLNRALARRLRVDIRAEPGAQRSEVALADARGDGGILRAGGGVELGGGHRAQGIGGEVPEGAAHPVDVLHATVAVGVRGDADQFLDRKSVV